MSRFEKEVLNGENWHSGMTQIKNDGKFEIYIENPSEVSMIRILDNLGKTIDTRTVVKKENQYYNNTLNSGVYFVEVIFENKVVRKKIVVN